MTSETGDRKASKAEDLFIEASVEQRAPIREPGQRVLERETLELLIRPAQLISGADQLRLNLLSYD